MIMSSWYIITDCFSCTLAERARESRVSQACRRVAQKIEKDKKLKINCEIGKTNKSVKNEDTTSIFCSEKEDPESWKKCFVVATDRKLRIRRP